MHTNANIHQCHSYAFVLFFKENTQVAHDNQNIKWNMAICNRSGYFMVIKPFCYDQGSQNYSLHWFFFPLLQLISTNKVPLRVNTLYQTLEAITIPSTTIVPLKFNQCKLHVANYLIFCMLLLEQ